MKLLFFIFHFALWRVFKRVTLGVLNLWWIVRAVNRFCRMRAREHLEISIPRSSEVLLCLNYHPVTQENCAKEAKSALMHIRSSSVNHIWSSIPKDLFFSKKYQMHLTLGLNAPSCCYSCNFAGRMKGILVSLWRNSKIDVVVGETNRKTVPILKNGFICDYVFVYVCTNVLRAKDPRRWSCSLLLVIFYVFAHWKLTIFISLLQIRI